MSSYTIYVLEMQAEIQRLGSELAEARREIQSLIESIWRAEYRREAPQWKPLPDLVGMITQMDNMYAGVREQRDQARWDKVEARDKALDEAAGEVSRQKWSDTIITACDRDGDEGPRWFNDACDECEKAIRALKSRSHTLSDLIASTADEYLSPKPPIL